MKNRNIVNVAVRLLSLVLFVAGGASCATFERHLLRQEPQREVETVKLRHHGGAFGVGGVVRLAPYDPLNIVVTHTDPNCFSFNVSERFASPSGATAASLYKADWNHPVAIPLVYDPDVSGYEIEAIKRQGAPATCDEAAEGTWIVRVERLGWGVGFAGAFLGDEITDPVFHLEEGEQVSTGADGESTSTSGFFVRRRESAEDSVRLGTAGMIHLFRESSASKVEVAPVSFGLGVSGGSDLRYYLGSSLKFGDRAFLTAGWAFGSRKRLPDALDIDDFTTNAQALSNLPSRNDDGFFVALSYSFLSTGVGDWMRSSLGIAKPKVTTSATTPAATTPAASGNAGGSAAPSGDGVSTSALRIRETALTATPGATVTIVVGADPAPPGAVEYTLTATQGADQLASALPVSYTFPRDATSHDVSIQLKADASGIVELEFRPTGGQEALQTVTITVVSSDG